MQTIDELINVLKIIIPFGVAMRVIFCLVTMIYSEDDRHIYKRKMINIIIFGVIAECCLVIKDVVMFYYK